MYILTSVDIKTFDKFNSCDSNDIVTRLAFDGNTVSCVLRIVHICGYQLSRGTVCEKNRQCTHHWTACTLSNYVTDRQL